MFFQLNNFSRSPHFDTKLNLRDLSEIFSDRALHLNFPSKIACYLIGGSIAAISSRNCKFACFLYFIFFKHPLINSFISTLTFAHYFTHAFIHAFCYFVHYLIHSLTNSFVQYFADSFIHSLKLLIHSVAIIYILH